MGKSERRKHHQIDVLADESPEHFAYVRDHSVNVEDAQAQHLLATKRKKLLCQFSSAFRCQVNLGELLDVVSLFR